MGWREEEGEEDEEELSGEETEEEDAGSAVEAGGVGSRPVAAVQGARRTHGARRTKGAVQGRAEHAAVPLGMVLTTAAQSQIGMAGHQSRPTIFADRASLARLLVR